jgi:acid phosphatase (class A)
VWLAGCANAPPAPPLPPTSPALLPELVKGTGVLIGYLDPKALPDSAALLPPPPALGSPAAAADEAAHRALTAQRATPRWQRAAADAELLKWPQATASFACTLGMPITEQATPHLAMLLRRTLADAGLATYAAKQRYQRARPFVQLKEPLCTPTDEALLAKDGSYPSGHASVGWAWGLILAELAPDRAGALIQRGLDYGTSRMVCGVHWATDVEAGRLIGAATVARMRAEPVFQRQADLARGEIAAARANATKPAADCAHLPG